MKTKKRRPFLHKLDYHTQEAIVVFLAIWLVICALIGYLFDLMLSPALKWGTPVWCVIYFGFLFKYFWVNPSGNHGLILVDPFNPLENPVTDEEMTNQKRVPRNQRAVMSGWHGKRPWEKPLVGEIFLGKAEVVPDKVVVQDKDNLPYEVPYQFVMTPLPGKYLPRYNISNATAAKGAFNQAIQSRIQIEFKKESGKKILEDPTAFNEGISKIFGGDDRVSSEEIDNGYSIGQITVGAIQLTPEVQKALQAQEINKLRAAGIDALRTTIEKDGGALAAKLDLGYTGGNVQFIEVGGLENARGDISLAALEALKNKPPKK